MDLEDCDVWTFETGRLGVGPWHEVASWFDVNLAEAVAELLTSRTTVALPESWQGEYSVQRAQDWITERDTDSSMMLAIETASRSAVGLLIIGEDTLDDGSLDLRIGYLFAEAVWGQGLATELVSGLVGWAGTQPRIRTLTGGVDPANPASVRVLEKCGFEQIGHSDDDVVVYRYEVSASSEWDSYAAGWDSDSAARAYASGAFESLQPLLRDAGIALDVARVIDFGCGTGLLTERLVMAGAQVDAVDTSTAMLDVLGHKIDEHNWSGVRIATALPDEAETFDLVVASSVCSFLDDYPATVQELVALLRPGGLFVQWDWERSDGESHGLTRDEIRHALGKAGLVDVAVADAFSVSIADQTMSPLLGHGTRPTR